MNTNKHALLAKVEAIFKNEKGTDWCNEVWNNKMKVAKSKSHSYVL